MAAAAGAAYVTGSMIECSNRRWAGWGRLSGPAGLAALVACGPARTPRPEAPPAEVQAPQVIGRHTPDTAALAREIPDQMRIGGVPGLSVAVVERGRVVWTGAFGTVNDTAGTPLDRETVFEAASMSKPVFAYLVLRLAERGDFDLDRPLLEMVEYPRLASDPRARRITGRMALSHASGLPNWGGDTLRTSFEPGTDYGYSGEGFTLLQKALERSTGRPLDELARREVFRPLGMTRSSFVWQERFAGSAAWAKSWLWRTAPVNRYSDANAAYTLVTTAGDYARFVAAVLTGRGLRDSTWRAFLGPVRETSPGIHIGLGIRLEDGPAGRRFYHSGSNGRRFTCYMAGDLATGVGLVFLTSAHDGTALVRPIASRVFGSDPAARHWDWYDRHDDPRRLALQSVRRAAAEQGADAARERLRALRSSPATRPTLDETLELGAFLAGRGLAPLSIEVLRSAVAESPDSASAHLELGRALESGGEIEAAIASYRRAAELGTDAEEARAHVRWAEERLAGRARRTAVSDQEMAGYAGDYRERTVTVRAGRLHFSGGAAAESPLVPLGDGLFELENDAAVRVRFVGGGSGPAEELIAIYRDGTVDRWLRER
jgi:CubicO group peptidase (beta-lactamase class C family)